jgi:hypothetical protein
MSAMALMVNPVKPSVPVVLGGLPLPDGVVPFVILLAELLFLLVVVVDL